MFFSAISCPSGYTQFDSESCYKIYSEATTLTGARQTCEADGATLLSLRTSNANERYRIIMGDESFSEMWLGAQLEQRDHYLWRYVAGKLYLCNLCSRFDVTPKDS